MCVHLKKKKNPLRYVCVSVCERERERERETFFGPMAIN